MARHDWRTSSRNSPALGENVKLCDAGIRRVFCDGTTMSRNTCPVLKEVLLSRSRIGLAFAAQAFDSQEETRVKSQDGSRK